jgi:hypothetical protein
MKCHNCDKLAMLTVTQAAVPLCLDCYIKWETINLQRMEMLERQHNLAADEVEIATGMPGIAARFPPRPPRTVIRGGPTLNNINISNSQIGVLNTGTIGTIDNAVGVIQQHGEPDAATALKTLTEAIAEAPDLSVADKNKALELTSLVATEAAAPAEKRRKGAMGAILSELGSTLRTSAAVVKIWEFAQPLIANLFSG